jgi:tRNA modification GTPase
VSGPETKRIGRLVVSPWPERARSLTRCVIHAPDKESKQIDDALAVFFPAPHSYTGEDLLEIHGHGGAYGPSATAAALVAAGARPAMAGEFTERAVLNGKLDLVRAEAVGDLVDARTTAMHRAALQGISGELSQQFVRLRSEAIALEALLAYDIDFPEEDDGPVARDRIDGAAQELERQLRSLAATTPAATLASEGALVVLAGPPNAGKSSLLNALVGESRVIVSEEPGTTRDAVEVLLDTEPWPIRLVDTAGLRENAGAVERLGIEISERYARRADVVLLCADTEEGMEAALSRVRELTKARIVRVGTKADLPSNAERIPADVRVSSTTGVGIPELQDVLAREVSACAGGVPETSTIITSARQRASIDAALREISEFRRVWQARELPAPVAASHLQGAVSSLDELIGVIDVDEVLARVFSNFCVGK